MKKKDIPKPAELFALTIKYKTQPADVFDLPIDDIEIDARGDIFFIRVGDVSRWIPKGCVEYVELAPVTEKDKKDVTPRLSQRSASQPNLVPQNGK